MLGAHYIETTFTVLEITPTVLIYTAFTTSTEPIYNFVPKGWSY